jgi:hypothetical protein
MLPCPPLSPDRYSCEKASWPDAVSSGHLMPNSFGAFHCMVPALRSASMLPCLKLCRQETAHLVVKVRQKLLERATDLSNPELLAIHIAYVRVTAQEHSVPRDTGVLIANPVKFWRPALTPPSSVDARDQKFESGSLQQRVGNEISFLHRCGAPYR